MIQHILLIIFSILIFSMFIYSGIDKVLNFNSKVQTLDKKLNSMFPISLINLAMILVIILEIIGPIIIILRIMFIKNENISKILNPLSNITLLLFLLFLIVVTFIYHPPNKGLIPFLSNCTTFGGLAVLGLLLNSKSF